jgi:NTE family protein
MLDHVSTRRTGHATKEELQRVLDEDTRAIYLSTGEQVRYNDLLKGRVDVDFVVRLERKNDSHTISNKIFDFSETTVRQLIQDGYTETKEQMKEVIALVKRELFST